MADGRKLQERLAGSPTSIPTAVIADVHEEWMAHPFTETDAAAIEALGADEIPS